MRLFVGRDWHRVLSPERMQKVSEAWRAWFKRLTDEGKAAAGHPLGFAGQGVSGKHRVVTDGPFAEAKEAISGYFMLDVATMDKALASAQCPSLPFGAKVEVRPVLAECPFNREYEIEEELAVAN